MKARRSPVARRLALTVAGFGAIALAVIVAAPLIGSTGIHLAVALDRSIPFADNLDAQILFVARLPRVIAAALVGSALAISGVIFQALLRNPLASPDTLGVSAGASLGAMIAITFDVDLSLRMLPPVAAASLLGAFGAMAIVFALSLARQRGAPSTVLLLAGVALQALLSAVSAFVQYLADFTATFRNVRWLMGSLDVVSYPPILAALLPLSLALLGAATLPRALNLLSMGPEAAAARGVDVPRAERVALLSASLATGASVSLAGPVGFIGIVVPHLVRLLVGADHRLVLPASALFGAAYLVACDTAARTMTAVELPVGIITAVIGAPVFLWLLLRSRGGRLS